jgi:hypothetical protein
MVLCRNIEELSMLCISQEHIEHPLTFRFNKLDEGVVSVIDVYRRLAIRKRKVSSAVLSDVYSSPHTLTPFFSISVWFGEWDILLAFHGMNSCRWK